MFLIFLGTSTCKIGTVESALDLWYVVCLEFRFHTSPFEKQFINFFTQKDTQPSQAYYGGYIITNPTSADINININTKTDAGDASLLNAYGSINLT